MARISRNIAMALLVILAATIVARPVAAQFYTPQMLEEERKRQEQIQRIRQEREREEAQKKAAEEAEQRRKEEAQRRVQQELQRARAGKSTVLRFGEETIGLQKLTTVTVFSNGAQRLLVVPNLQEKDGRWVPDAELIAALRKLLNDQYDVVHSEQLLGIEFVVGVGQESPKSLQAWAALRNQKLAIFDPAEGRRVRTTYGTSGTSSTAGTTDAASGDENDAQSEDAGGVALGRFIGISEDTLDGKRYKVITIERGLQMIRTKFWLLEHSGRSWRNAPRSLLKKAEELKAGQSVRLTYEVIEGQKVVKAIGD